MAGLALRDTRALSIRLNSSNYPTNHASIPFVSTIAFAIPEVIRVGRRGLSEEVLRKEKRSWGLTVWG
jgi:hypothetical protein